MFRILIRGDLVQIIHPTSTGGFGIDTTKMGCPSPASKPATGTPENISEPDIFSIPAVFKRRFCLKSNRD